MRKVESVRTVSARGVYLGHVATRRTVNAIGQDLRRAERHPDIGVGIDRCEEAENLRVWQPVVAIDCHDHVVVLALKQLDPALDIWQGRDAMFIPYRLEPAISCD